MEKEEIIRALASSVKLADAKIIRALEHVAHLAGAGDMERAAELLTYIMAWGDAIANIDRMMASPSASSAEELRP